MGKKARNRQEQKAAKERAEKRARLFTILGVAAGFGSWAYFVLNPTPNLYFGFGLISVCSLVVAIAIWEYFKKAVARIVLIALVIVGFVAAKNWAEAKWHEKSQARLHIRKFEILPLEAGKQMWLNVTFENSGKSETTVKGYSLSLMMERPHDLSAEIEAEDRLFGQLADVIRQGGALEHEIPPDSESYISDPGPILSAEQLRETMRGKYYFYFVGKLMYRDAVGNHETSYCIYNDGEVRRTFLCRKHNEEL